MRFGRRRGDPPAEPIRHAVTITSRGGLACVCGWRPDGRRKRAGQVEALREHRIDALAAEAEEAREA